MTTVACGAGIAAPGCRVTTACSLSGSTSWAPPSCTTLTSCPASACRCPGSAPSSALAGDQLLEHDAGFLALNLAQAPLVAEQRGQGAVVAAVQDLGRPLARQGLRAFGVGPPGHRVVQVIQIGPGTELVLQPVQHHVELER